MWSSSQQEHGNQALQRDPQIKIITIQVIYSNRSKALSHLGHTDLVLLTFLYSSPYPLACINATWQREGNTHLFNERNLTVHYFQGLRDTLSQGPGGRTSPTPITSLFVHPCQSLPILPCGRQHLVWRRTPGLQKHKLCLWSDRRQVPN